MIQLIKKSTEKITFKTDLSVSILNAIRRSVNYIPILAIDTVEISKNDSALYDEMIAHRLGLVPLKNENLKLPEDCDCGKEEGCGKCSIKLKISTTGPEIVYSTQLTPKDSVVYKMPITILDKDQEFELVAIAKMGRGVQHAKFSPGLMFYRYSDDLEKEDDESFRKLVEHSKKADNNEMLVFIDSWGQMPAKDIFTSAIDALQEELKDFSKKLKL